MIWLLATLLLLLSLPFVLWPLLRRGLRAAGSEPGVPPREKGGGR